MRARRNLSRGGLCYVFVDECCCFLVFPVLGKFRVQALGEVLGVYVLCRVLMSAL